MKKLTVLWILLCCASFLYAQNSMKLDAAIHDSVSFFSSKIPTDSTIAVINFEAETQGLSDFIVQELLVAFGNTGNVRIVERSRLEMLEAELNFNMSGAVSDETAQGIGHMIGAQIIFSGSIAQYRDMYRMRVQGITVETAEIIGIRTIDIQYDPTLTGLLGRINPADQWKYQWLYAGGSFGYASPSMTGALAIGRDDFFVDADFPPLGFSAYLMVQPFDLFGIALDMGVSLPAQAVMPAILPTLTIRPAGFEVDIFFGVGMKQKDPLFIGGIRAGKKIGPGVLFAEARTLMFDYINATLGYQIGFLPRKK